jgi:hypothetical protein
MNARHLAMKREHAMHRPFAAALMMLTLFVCAAGCAQSTSTEPSFADLPPRDRLESHVVELSKAGSGARHRSRPDAYAEAVAYLTQQLASVGLGDVHREYVPGYEDFGPNLYVEVAGSTLADEIVVIGAHYDSVDESPGADDNASGVAVVIELARAHAVALARGDRFGRTVRYILFTNEESPYFNTGDMGSQVHARRARADGQNIVAMIAVEMVGYFSDEPGSQRYPMGVSGEMLGGELPDVGNFIAVVARLGEDAGLEREIAEAMRSASDLPVVPAALPGFIWHIRRSDHGPFWSEGFRAAMVTDTSEFRNALYHTPEDTPDTLDYERMAEVLRGMQAAVRRLATADGDTGVPGTHHQQ